MKLNRLFSICCLSLLFVSIQNSYADFEAKNMKDLLQEIRKIKDLEDANDRKRLKEFRSARNKQQTILNNAKAELKRLERRSEELKKQFYENEKILATLEEEKQLKLGNLGEAIGVFGRVSGSTAETLKQSIISSQLPNRHQQLEEYNSRGNVVPKTEELRDLWLALQEEMTEQGKVFQFDTNVWGKNREEKQTSVIRVGTFNLIANNQYLNYDHATQLITQIDRQPTIGGGGRLDIKMNDYSYLALDPAQGKTILLETRRETWPERVKNYGGIVGLVIGLVLLLGLVISLERVLVLMSTGSQMRRQAKNDKPGKNPLGRVMAVYLANKDDDVENLELKLDEAVLKEIPRLEKRVSVIKVFAAVSPLLGLLGTVTGMIETFQAITLYGTGDASTMAGGISSALITTVLGIVSAIPLILLHSLVASRSKNLVHLLEERSAGLIAQRAESQQAS